MKNEQKMNFLDDYNKKQRLKQRRLERERDEAEDWGQARRDYYQGR